MIEFPLFNQLPTWSQIDVLTKKGIKIASRNHQDWEITLYAVNNFFVECWAKPHLQIIGSFQQNASPLLIFEPYTEKIQLQDFGFGPSGEFFKEA